MIETFDRNVAGTGIHTFPLGDPRQGIVHVIGPEQGITQPGLVIVCGDSHTSTVLQPQTAARATLRPAP